MTSTAPAQASEASAAAAPATWLQAQLDSLLRQQGHAWLLHGPSGLGQFDLALALARSWLCDQPAPSGACGVCSSCHAVDVHTHADLCLLLPETLSLSLGWPLDEKTQSDLDAKKRKPSKEIKVDAARDAVTFTQLTRSRGSTKVVLVFPAERMNHITANTLLKTLEEPPGAVKFILASEAAHQLLPTLRSRCIAHTMVWPDFERALAWLVAAVTAAHTADAGAKKSTKAAATVNPEDLRTLLRASGGRPADALQWALGVTPTEAAQHWRALPVAMAHGDVGALSVFDPPAAVDALQKVCHDALALHAGAAPRFFNTEDFSTDKRPADRATGSRWYGLTQWARELSVAARTVEHPYNPSLMIEALASRAQQALTAR